jgi:hypothetical protein
VPPLPAAATQTTMQFPAAVGDGKVTVSEVPGLAPLLLLALWTTEIVTARRSPPPGQLGRKAA